MRIGDRVIIHTPGAKDALDTHRGHRLGCTYNGLPAIIIGHTAQQNLRTGTVAQCSGGLPCKFGAALGHEWVVLYDEPYFHADATRWAGHFAANELEPLEQVPAPATNPTPPSA